MKIQNLTMIQGETVSVTVVLTDGNGALLDLAGYDVRYEAETATPIVKDLDDGSITLSENIGEFTFTIEPEDTELLTISGTQRFDHECRVESPDGEITVVFRGKLIITEWVIDNMDE